jgi:hypothetical protein
LSPAIGFRELQRRVTRFATSRGVPEARLYQRIATEVLFNVLESSQQRGIIDRYAVKGGMALEVRFGMRARASRDVDVSVPILFEDIPRVLDDVLTVGFDNFTMRRRGSLRVLEQVKAYRAEVEIQYAGKVLYKLHLDINGSDFEPSVDVVPSGVLTELGLPGPVQVALLDVTAQLAHKIHAATQPSTETYQNERYRDVLDALIIAEIVSLDYDWVRIVCGAEFARRGTHGWPPSFDLDERWRAGLLAEAASHGGFPRDAKVIAERFKDLLAKIEGLPMYEVLETRVIEVSADSLTADAKGAGELGALLGQGWQIASMSQDASNVRRQFVVLERRRMLARGAREIPRLQTRLEMQGILKTQEVTALQGKLKNVGAAANYVRLIIPGVQQDYAARSTTRFGTIANGDEVSVAVPLTLGLLQQPDANGPWELVVEYEDDAGQKFRQTGALEAYAGFINVRLYQVLGLRGPMPIEQYSVPYADR